MATVRLSDIIDVIVFQDMPAINSPEKTAFYESGIAVRNGMLDAIASGPGKIAEVPFWNDLDADSAPNLSTDNPADVASPEKIVQGEQVCRKAFLNKGWSESDLASELVLGPKAMDQIRARVDTYWTRQWQRRLVASLNGILADNVANDGSDMVFDAAGATNADVTASTVFSRQNFTSAAFTLGDQVDQVAAISVHSVVYKRMVDNDDIDFIPDSQGRMTIPTFLGKRVIVDDGMPFTPAAGAGGGDAAPRYTSVLFGPGALGWGEGSAKIPVELERQEAQGNGAGVETIWTRKTWLLHPSGFKVDATPAGNSFTLAELAAAATWDRVVVRKNVPVAFLVTNG
jgi:hypothetical protein